MNPYDVEKNTHQYFYRTFLLYFYFFLPTTPLPTPPSQSGSSHSGARGVHAKWIIPRWSSETRSSGAVWSAFSLEGLYLATLSLAPRVLPGTFHALPPKIFCTSRFFNLSSLSQCYSQCFTNYHSAFEIS